MSFALKITASIATKKLLAAIDNDDKFWVFAANEWWRLYEPWVPYDTGTLYEQVDIDAKMIEHTATYAHRQYYGDKINHNTNMNVKHPLACARWDEAAKKTQKKKLAAALQAYINSGRLTI